MNDRAWLVECFEEHRPHLKAVAYRMLGSLAEADDAVQDAWLRLSRSGAAGVDNVRGWLTTIVARVCLIRSLGVTVARGKIVEIVAITDPERLRHLGLAVISEVNGGSAS